MTNSHKFVEFKELPIDQLRHDPNQPREGFNTNGDKNRLRLSVEELGIQQPIAVMKIGTDTYQIIDGHRRFQCAEDLGMEAVPCHVYQRLESGELERVRFELQNNRRLWKPLERAKALANFKQSSQIGTNKEIAQQLFISETLISNSLKLEELKSEYKELMDKYGLSQSYRFEFVRLHPKLRPIKEFSIDDIIITIFERVAHKIIRSSKDFRTLGRIFLRATANHNQIHAFLLDPDMPVKELEQNTVQSSFTLWLEQSIKKIKANEKAEIPFSSQEKVLLFEMQKLLNKTLE